MLPGSKKAGKEEEGCGGGVRCCGGGVRWWGTVEARRIQRHVWPQRQRRVLQDSPMDLVRGAEGGGGGHGTGVGNSWEEGGRV